MSDEHAIGLPPPKDGPLVEASPHLIRFARVVNLLGLITPSANAGTFFVVPKDRRWFGMVAGWICAGVLVYALKHDLEHLALAALSVHYALVLVGLVNPLWVGNIGAAWNAFGTLLGKVMSYPMFTAVYFLAVTPTALLVRAFGKDPLGVKTRGAATYWTPHEPPSKEKYERQF
jgi:hypothetical protein